MAVFVNIAGFADIKPDPADLDFVLVSDGTALCWDGSTVPEGQGCGHIIHNPADHYEPPAGMSLVLRDEWKGEMYVPPVSVVVPDQVEAWRIKAILVSMPGRIGGGTLLEDANVVASKAGGVAAIAWNGAPFFTRASPTIAALAPTLGLEPADLDRIFIEAAQVEA